VHHVLGRPYNIISGIACGLAERLIAIHTVCPAPYSLPRLPPALPAQTSKLTTDTTYEHRIKTCHPQPEGVCRNIQIMFAEWNKARKRGREEEDVPAGFSEHRSVCFRLNCLFCGQHHTNISPETSNSSIATSTVTESRSSAVSSLRFQHKLYFAASRPSHDHTSGF
jgi:hypothetical protein